MTDPRVRIPAEPSRPRAPSQPPAPSHPRSPSHPPAPSHPRAPSRFALATRRVAWAAVILSFPVWLAAFLVAPFLPLPAAERAAWAAACLVAGEALFWGAGLVLGADVLRRFRPPKVTTGKSFVGKRVAIIGATGGLGSAVARAVLREGGAPILVGRDPEKLRALQHELALDPTDVAIADVVDATQLRRAAASITTRGPLHHVVCATGLDVRKPLDAHTDDDVERSLAVDLRGPIHVARAFLPHLEADGVVALFGGFGDGTVALPYSTVDVAARAGLAGFCASTNRELELEGDTKRLCYLSPAPADTEAERPFAELWREMGVQMVEPVEVANVTLRALAGRKTVAVMGASTRLLARVGGVIPWLGHVVVVWGLGRALRRRFSTQARGPATV